MAAVKYTYLQRKKGETEKRHYTYNKINTQPMEGQETEESRREYTYRRSWMVRFLP